MANERYTVLFPRKYHTRDGQEKTHFWPVGVAWPLPNKDGFSVELYINVLPGKKLVIMPVEEREQRGSKNEPLTADPPEDDIPF